MLDSGVSHHYLLIFSRRVSEVRMNCALRHSRQGGDGVEETAQPEPLTPYEEVRNIRRKALHDEVERALIDSGFGDAAKLRPLFTRKFAEKEGIGETSRKLSRTHRRILSRQGEVHLRRSARNVGKVNTNIESSPIFKHRNKQVSFHTRPPLFLYMHAY